MTNLDAQRMNRHLLEKESQGNKKCATVANHADLVCQFTQFHLI